MTVPTEPIGSIPRPLPLIDAVSALGDDTDPKLDPLNQWQRSWNAADGLRWDGHQCRCLFFVPARRRGPRRPSTRSDPRLSHGAVDHANGAGNQWYGERP